MIPKPQVQVVHDGRHRNPLPLVVACRCSGCEGELHSDGDNPQGTLGFLTCTVCGCTYAIGVTKASGG